MSYLEMTEIHKLRAQLSTAEAERDAVRGERMFPVQKSRQYGKPHPLLIPWSVAELAYSQYHHSQTLERIAERGGFGPSEMDTYYPDWIARCDELTALRARVEEQAGQIKAVRDVAESSMRDPNCTGTIFATALLRMTEPPADTGEEG